jgi:hypothetical protein
VVANDKMIKSNNSSKQDDKEPADMGVVVTTKKIAQLYSNAFYFRLLL